MKWYTPMCITFVSLLCCASLFAFAFQASNAISAEQPHLSGSVEPVPVKVVSIGGANTEILFKLGLGNRVIGSDTTSYYPEEAQKMPKVGYMRALSAEGILSLEPDVIFASEGSGPVKVLTQLKDLSTPWVTLPEVTSLDVLYKNIAKIGQVMSVETQSLALINALKKEQSLLEGVIQHDTHKPKVLFVMQHTGTPMVAGNNTAADRIIRLAGGENVAATIEGYKPLTTEALIALNPQWILSTFFGEGKQASIEGISKIPGLSFTDASEISHIIAMDALLLVGFGPRTIDAANQLRASWQAGKR
ncbi:heme/hemin ABC transporter substrate-binding protein [Marinomonas algicola]|uniref:heme/hemin ABC transporter substrate-binding protein n=1 Tax=Marinomonas algicola TaxID=2773454 RepID=UPI00174BD34B|nr:ABC transporter substrate-binding protein [Marinomonas algicola]